MNIPRRALVLLLWPAFCGLVVGGGLGLITASLSAGLLFAGIAAVVSLLILNGWEMENIGESEGSRAFMPDPVLEDPVYANLSGSVVHSSWDKPCSLSISRNCDPIFSHEVGNVFHTWDQHVHGAEIDDGRDR